MVHLCFSNNPPLEPVFIQTRPVQSLIHFKLREVSPLPKELGSYSINIKWELVQTVDRTLSDWDWELARLAADILKIETTSYITFDCKAFADLRIRHLKPHIMKTSNCD
jgi:hypothetical protein